MRLKQTGAAYTTILSLYPTQKSVLDARQAQSLLSLSADTNSPAITKGLAWGQHGEIGLAQSDGIGEFYQPLLRGTFQESNSAED